MAIKTDGSLWAWGWNGYGQFGNGTTTSSYYPVRSGSDNDWSAVTLGGYYTAALKSDGTFWTWGSNFYGELGDGTNTVRLSPAQVNVIPNFRMTVSKSGTGTGTVTSDLAAISCGADCDEIFYNNTTVVTLTPVPDPGFVFAGWSGHPDCLDGSVTMDADKTCTATFNLLPYGFIGPLSPYASPDERSYKVKSAIPIKWQYADSSGNVINSSAMNPMISIAPSPCSGGDDGAAIMLDDAGQSGYQYDSITNTWQFNWKTTDMQSGCYNIRVTNSQTSQINGPFPIKLVR
ncbi:MAG: PxKF domain-containing protein [Nitrospirae bacterium]|nr:PxKF domain-containing protein [Nitrospirota bacterium]